MMTYNGRSKNGLSAMRGQFRLNSSSPKSDQHPFFFQTISIHYQEKRLRELIIKNDHQREQGHPMSSFEKYLFGRRFQI